MVANGLIVSEGQQIVAFVRAVDGRLTRTLEVCCHLGLRSLPSRAHGNRENDCVGNIGSYCARYPADERGLARPGRCASRSCDFTAHMCTGMILSNYKLFVNSLFKLISIEHVIIGSKTQWKTM